MKTASVSSSRVESQARSNDRPARSMVVVVTGASSGVGLETAKQLAHQGAQVVMVGRDRARGEWAFSQVASVTTGKTPVLLFADLSVQADVRHLADEIKGRYDHVDILINNAGAAFNDRRFSADGIERTWATNQLAPFLLTHLLLPLLMAGPAGRVVNVASEVYSRKLDPGNLQGERKYSWMGAYKTSKLGVLLFTTELARRLAGSGVTVVAVSPGPTKTNFGAGGLSGPMGVMMGALKHTPMLKPAEQSARGVVWAATDRELVRTSGSFYLRFKRQTLKGDAADPVAARKVWAISEEQTGLRPGASVVSKVTEARPNGRATAS